MYCYAPIVSFFFLTKVVCAVLATLTRPTFDDKHTILSFTFPNQPFNGNTSDPHYARELYNYAADKSMTYCLELSSKASTTVLLVDLEDDAILQRIGLLGTSSVRVAGSISPGFHRFTLQVDTPGGLLKDAVMRIDDLEALRKLDKKCPKC